MAQVEIQPGLRFTRFNIANLKFSVAESQWKNESISKDTELKMAFSSTHSQPDKSVDLGELKLVFKVDVFNSDKSFQLDFEAVAFFDTRGLEDDSIRALTIIKQSAPAIIFPYIRATISTVTQQFGFRSVILPIFNFTKYIKDQENEADDISQD